MSKRKTPGYKASRGNSLISAAKVSGKTSGSISMDRELRRLGVQIASEAKPIHFGTPSRTAGSSQKSSGGLLSQLLRKTSSQGVSGLVGSGLLGVFGKSLISGVGSLVGGSAVEMPAVNRFSLPDSQNRTIDIGSSRSLRATETTTSPSNQTYSDRNAEIVRVVKQALLTSSQLNDVISEI